MNKKNSEEQLLYRRMLEELVPYADKQLKEINRKLTPGTTYTAKEIVKAVGLNKHEIPTGQFVEVDQGKYAVGSWNVFNQIAQCEKYAGITARNSKRWTVPDGREIAANTTATFGSMKQMKILASIIKKRARHGHEKAVLSLADGGLRIIVSDGISHSDDVPFRLRGYSYEAPEEFAHLSFMIQWQQIKEMYGECKLYLYKDSEADLSSYLNPYHIRLVVENADGRCFSSNEIVPVAPEFYSAYDADFTDLYLDDRLPKHKDKKTQEECQPVISDDTEKDVSLHDVSINASAATPEPLSVSDDLPLSTHETQKLHTEMSLKLVPDKPRLNLSVPITRVLTAEEDAPRPEEYVPQQEHQLHMTLCKKIAN